MKAVVRKRYGAAEVLEVIDQSIPRLRDGEILIKVQAFTVNRTDCGILAGKPYLMRLFSGLFTPREKTPGTDFAGEVVAVGEKVTRHKVGDRVMGFNDNGSAASQAEYTVKKEGFAMVKIPPQVDARTAAASLEGAHYAYNFINKLKLRPGERILVNGGTGAIGSAAIQMLKHYGIHVVATAPTDHVEAVQSLGADEVIDFQSSPISELEDTFDAVFDAVGKSTFGVCKRLLHPHGVYISSELGPGWENIWRALLSPFQRGRKVIFPVPVDIPGSLAFISTLLASGALRPLIDERTYTFEEIKNAYRYVCAGKKIGNVVIQPTP